MALIKRRLYRFIIFILAFAACVLFLNWLMTYRLEDRLRNIISSRVSEATSGFYNLSYEQLKVDFFTGELMFKELDFRPDAEVFETWQKADSLPETYFRIHMESIEFKGVNLTWLFDYSNIHFELLEILSPHVEIVQPVESSSRIKNTSEADPKTLYELISPYIDVITIKEFNFLNSNVSYIIENPDEPSVYALTDAGFRAYGFRLDKNSSLEGKLLYCDNFEFTAEKEQILLSDPDLLLKAGNIRLSTVDSLIAVNKIDLISKYENTDSTDYRAGTYVDAEIRSIMANGIYFSRKNNQSFLDAQSLRIADSDIKYTMATDNKNTRNVNEIIADTVDKSQTPWSLYGIVSPLLNEVSIDEIEISNAGFEYRQIADHNTDTYTFDKLDFTAIGFKLDSLSGISGYFMYSMDYVMEVTGLEATVNSKNQKLNIDHVSLNTIRKNFSVEKASLQPVEPHRSKDYLEGTVDSLTIDGLLYAVNRIYADSLVVTNPEIKYVINKYGRKPTKITNKSDSASNNSFDNFIAAVGELDIKNIFLRDAYLTINDNSATISNDYRVNRLNFYATDFRMNKNTRNGLFGFFECSNLGFDIRNFDNFLPEKQYRLKFDRAYFSHNIGRLHISNLQLIPQTDNWDEVPEMYYSVSLPMLDIRGIKRMNNNFHASSLRMNSPAIGIINAKNLPLTEIEKQTQTQKNQSFINHIIIDKITLDSLDFFYKDIPSDKTFQLDYNSINIYKAAWNNQNKNIVFDKAVMAGIVFQYENPSYIFQSNVPLFTASGSDMAFNGEKSYINHNAIKIESPLLDYRKKPITQKNDEIPEITRKVNRDIYSELGSITNSINLGSVEISDIRFNTESLTQGGFPFKQLDSIYISAENFRFGKNEKIFDMADFRFSASNLDFPLDNGMYNLKIGKMEGSKKESAFDINAIHLLASYPKHEFAYRHPTHKDWFDVTVDNVKAEGLDYLSILKGGTIKGDNLIIDNVVLQNFKNQQIEIEHNIMPMVYETLQKAPVPFDFTRAQANNFTVIYEEMPKTRNTAGILNFNGMNGYIEGLTNVIKHPDQYIRLDADGLFLGAASFDATWLIPVDTLNDCFFLKGHIHEFNMNELNKVIEPLAAARIDGGVAKDAVFDFEASSHSAQVNMQFLYNDLKFTILKQQKEDSLLVPNKFITGLANLFILQNNPKRENAQPRTSDLTVIRDPYHSTFNYFWQILQPPLGEAVGISQETQNFGKKVSGFFGKVKNFFSFKKKDKKD